MKTKTSLEWSRKQNCFHIDNLDNVIEKNLRVALDPTEYNGDWKIVGVFDTHEEASKIMHHIRDAQQYVISGVKNP